MNKDALSKQWKSRVSKHLVGKTVKLVRYLTEEETEQMGWYHRAIMIEFTDGTQIVPSADDEGNDAGALFTSVEDLPVIPVI